MHRDQVSESHSLSDCTLQIPIRQCELSHAGAHSYTSLYISLGSVVRALYNT